MLKSDIYDDDVITISNASSATNCIKDSNDNNGVASDNRSNNYIKKQQNQWYFYCYFNIKITKIKIQ